MPASQGRGPGRLADGGGGAGKWKTWREAARAGQSTLAVDLTGNGRRNVAISTANARKGNDRPDLLKREGFNGDAGNDK